MEHIKPLTIDEIYISPFTARRVYTEDGDIKWIPIERNLTPTGERHVDALLQAYAEGHSNVEWIAQRLGCTSHDVWGFVRVLTGMDMYSFRHAYGFRLADDLLRYTSMTIGEVARRSGFSTASLMCQQFRKYRNMMPSARRTAIRQPHDEDRYRV